MLECQLKNLEKMKKDKIVRGVRILISSLIPIFFGPLMIHLGQIKDNHLIIILGVFICVTAIVMIFISLFGIINELFKK